MFLNIGDAINGIAEKYCIVPTNQGVVCNLSPGASILDAAKLESSITNACVSLGVKSVLTDTLPKDLVVPNQLWSYIHRGNRDGIIKAIDASSRKKIYEKKMSPFNDVSDEIKLNLYGYITCEENGPISDMSKQALRSFPIFQNYSNDQSQTKNIVALNTNQNWFILKSYTKRDELLMTSDFISHSKENQAELKLLISLGIQQLSHVDFFHDFVIPRLPILDEKTRIDGVGNMLEHLPSLCDSNPKFFTFLMEAKIIPSAVSS